MFDTVSISVVFVSKIETAPSARVLERCRTIDEKHGVVDVVFLAKVGEECVSKSVGSYRFKRCMEQFV